MIIMDHFTRLCDIAQYSLVWCVDDLMGYQFVFYVRIPIYMSFTMDNFIEYVKLADSFIKFDAQWN